MTARSRALLQLHFCVIIWGFTAILGGLISLQALALVWWRVVICCAVLVFVVPLNGLRVLPRARLWRFLGIGGLVGLHWLCFYGAIKWANASVAVITMATTSFFAAFVEPLVLKTRFKWREALTGLLVLPGIYLVVDNIDWSMRAGFYLGLLGALLAAVFSVLNKREIDRGPAPPLLVTFIELGAIVVLLGLLLPLFPPAVFWPTQGDWLWLTVLAVVCTLLPYYLTLLAMRELSAFTTNLAVVLEPVYGVFLAALILHEHQALTPGFYWGAVWIFALVVGSSVWRMKG